jgi:hypothetical protein
MLASLIHCRLYLPAPVCANMTFAGQLSMLNAIIPWRHAGHLVEAPTEVALVGESGCDGDVNEREVCARDQLLRTQ